MRQWITLIENAQPRISSEIRHDTGVAIIHDFFIPKAQRGRGAGRRAYEEWEANLPQSIRLVRLFAADYDGTGNSDGFWNAVGFSYNYDGEDLSYEAKHAMWKGVNGHPTPKTIIVDGDEDA